MPLKAVIFDFNGTLFWDTPYHNQAWDQFLENHQLSLSDIDKHRLMHGKPNRDIFPALFERTLTENEIAVMVEEKESIYRSICQSQIMELAPGAIDFLGYLQREQIPFTIATSSGKENVDFYFQNLPLDRWFDRNNLVYDNGTFNGKPQPDIFLMAAKNLKQNPSEILILEDAPAGIKAAENAGAGKIYIVNSDQDSYDDWPHEIIVNFDQVDRSIF